MVTELVEKFEAQKEAYRSPQYNEAQTRQEFLNPLFEALGWDVYNRQGHSETYKEVIHEDAIKVGGRTKAPDYCFRVGGGIRTFFVEAKKPALDIHEAVEPAYQLRRYAWSAKLPLGILTDFEEFAIYDCRIRPAHTDKAATARVKYLKYTEYVDRWDELYDLISPEAIRRGAIEKFLASRKVKKGTAEVDVAFLEEIESWRTDLAGNVAIRNPGVSQRDLNFAVQRTIDRIVFLRICEDRGVEPYGVLQKLLNGSAVYARLGEVFQRADERYNSGLFYFTREPGRLDPPDEMTLSLEIDDKALKDILKNLYFPDSPYEFSVLPAEILGQIYEQFLGKVIRLTKGHQARVEEKPEVRKAGGVYYTPSYVVDYIVRQTVGRLVAGKSPRGVEKLRVLDPACGSGSFLIGAYQFLLDWHRDWYEAHDPEKHARGRSPKVYRGRSGEWRLTTAERKRILVHNIFGVDIDSQAVEVTKLSLLLKVLEGESRETLESQFRLFHERALPDLGGNVKCGNSLVGPDYYAGRQREMFDEEEMYRVNAFDWRAEFPEILKGRNPGFDAVIGNPPYVRMESFKRAQVLSPRALLLPRRTQRLLRLLHRTEPRLAARGRRARHDRFQQVLAGQLRTEDPRAYYHGRERGPSRGPCRSAGIPGRHGAHRRDVDDEDRRQNQHGVFAASRQERLRGAAIQRENLGGDRRRIEIQSAPQAARESGLAIPAAPPRLRSHPNRSGDHEPCRLLRRHRGYGHQVRADGSIRHLRRAAQATPGAESEGRRHHPTFSARSRIFDDTTSPPTMSILSTRTMEST